MWRVIVFIDVVGSAELRRTHGDIAGNQIISARLQNIENTLRKEDASVDRSGPAEGDSILLTGTDLVALFHSAVVLQNEWIGWPLGPPVRISIGSGEFEVLKNGSFKSLMGVSLDLTKRIGEKCPRGGVVITEGARGAVQAAGLAYKLIRVTEKIDGFGEEAFYEADGAYVIPVGEQQRAESDGKNKGVLEEINVSAKPPPESIPGAIFGSEPQAQIHRNGFWRNIAMIGMALLVVAIVTAVYVVVREYGY